MKIVLPNNDCKNKFARSGAKENKEHMMGTWCKRNAGRHEWADRHLGRLLSPGPPRNMHAGR